MNNNGWKTPSGKEYQMQNVRIKYLNIIKNNL